MASTKCAAVFTCALLALIQSIYSPPKPITSASIENAFIVQLIRDKMASPAAFLALPCHDQERWMEALLFSVFQDGSPGFEKNKDEIKTMVQAAKEFLVKLKFGTDGTKKGVVLHAMGRAIAERKVAKFVDLGLQPGTVIDPAKPCFTTLDELKAGFIALDSLALTAEGQAIIAHLH